MNLLRILSYTPYFFRPVLLPEFGRRALRRLKLQSVYTGFDKKDEAVAWCRQEAIDLQTFAAKANVDPSHFQPFSQRFADVMSEASRVEKECPVKMGGAGNLELLYGLCEHARANRVIETGVAYGWSSLAVLLSLANRKQAALVSIDLPYFELKNDPWVGVVVPQDLCGQWTLLRMADREGLPRALNRLQTIDLAHYDSDKTYDGRTWAYRLLWQSLRAGGVLVSDDINDNLAFCDFCKSVGAQPYVISHENKFQGVVFKP